MRVHELTRYPIKSMAGTPIDSTFLGWHGLEGDRRFAFRRLDDNNGFPWLSASRLPDLILYAPFGQDEHAQEPAPTHVRTPDGAEFAVNSSELRSEIAGKFGSAVELMKMKHGIFDEGIVSVIHLNTISKICREAGNQVDARRFRANVVVASENGDPFLEDAWVGGQLVFGDDDTGPVLNVAMRDERCVMINLDPQTATQDPNFMKAAVRLNGNNAGVYGQRIQWIARRSQQ